MVPIANQPILEYVIEAVAAAGIEELVLVIGHERDRIQTYFGNGDAWGVDIEYVTQEPQLGTGHAVAQLESLVGDDFLVLNGDRIINSELIACITSENVTAPALAVTRVDTPLRYGVVALDRDHITAITEKPTGTPTSEIINAGIYRFSPDIFDAIERTEPGVMGEQTLPGAITTLLAERNVQAVRNNGVWMDISHLWDILSATDVVLDQQGSSAAGAIDPTAAVGARVCVDRDATVGPNSTLRGATTLGQNVTIEANAVVSNTVVLQDATISDGAILRDCIVSENATIGPNTTVTGGPARMIVDETIHDEVQLGGVVGDNTRVGANVTIQAGTVIGDNATIGDGTVVEGRIAPQTIIKRG